MRELSLHILDLVQNSIAAGATQVEISIHEDSATDKMIIAVADNGCGMDEKFLKQVLDPFTTTRTTRKVGLGLPMLEMVTRRCNGRLDIESAKGKGTRVTASFQLSHWDRVPLGDIVGTIITIVVANPQLNLLYYHSINGRSFKFDTMQIREVLGEEVPLNNPMVTEWIEGFLKQGLDNLSGGVEVNEDIRGSQKD